MRAKILAITAVAEAATGLLLVIYPAMAVEALFGTDIDPIGTIMSRIAGCALLGLGVSCWPGNPNRQQLYGMFVYSIFVMMYLFRIGIRGAPVGRFLWPAVIAHAILIVLLIVAAVKGRKSKTT